jgi:sec-independent protein translocase protein TatA
MRLGPWEIGLILVIVLIVFGVGKLPQIGGAVGKSIRNFKKAQTGDEEEETSKPKADSEKKTV